MRAMMVVAGLVASLGAVDDAEACSCLQPDVIRAYNLSDEVLVGTITAQAAMGPYIVYTVRVQRDLKGCRTAGSFVRIGTSASEAACGVLLPTSTPMLLFATQTTLPTGQQVLATNACQANKPVSQVTLDEREFLLARPVTCGGVTTCNDGTAPYACLVDPCTTAPGCPGARCSANYCGGCVAEYYYPTREGACMPW